MYSLRPTVLLVTLVTHYGLSRAQCPAVWTDVAADLKSTFVGSDGKCTDDARAAIRLSFHDCFPSTCDGSIILSSECTDRGENTQLVGICSTLADKVTQFDVGAADLIQFAAAACPGGPMVPVKVGRPDSSEPDITSQMISPNANATTIIAAFAAKGFSVTELVALMGAHSTAKDLNGDALDTTVGDMDMTYYTETAEGGAPTSLNSDKFLSNSTETSSLWSAYGLDPAAWAAAFVPAMEKMSLMGNDEASLTDCSSVLTAAFA
ncbi:hypothetical protein AAE478_000536 [Parahypoxylon ruwenzoriense]